MITITFNGLIKEIPENSTVSEVLESFGYKKSKASVWMDGVQLMLSEYDTRIVLEGSLIKALRVLGGG